MRRFCGTHGAYASAIAYKFDCTKPFQLRYELSEAIHQLVDRPYCPLAMLLRSLFIEWSDIVEVNRQCLRICGNCRVAMPMATEKVPPRKDSPVGESVSVVLESLQRLRISDVHEKLRKLFVWIVGGKCSLDIFKFFVEVAWFRDLKLWRQFAATIA
jgi:hypothetical protein